MYYYDDFEIATFAMLDERDQQQCLKPEWELAGKVHDWRNHIPDHVQRIWETFTLDQKAALFVWAEYDASNEEWD
jgi:hypothetical protein